ncbi:RNA-directed DNA polymerase, eukaryota [Tanacetum coccineum]
MKLSKVGKRFAFVRFLKPKNIESLINELNKIWIGSYHIFAAKARFEMNQKTSTNVNPKPPSFNHSTKEKPDHQPNRTFANVLNGNVSKDPAPQTKSILKTVTLDESDLLNTSDTKNAILAKVRDVHLIPNINTVLNKEGFYNFQCKYIGGLWLWIEFDSQEACTKLQSNSEVSWYFSHLKNINQSFVLDERVVWIEISGLPLNAWSPNAFKKVANIWGSPLFVDDDPNENCIP